MNQPATAPEQIVRSLEQLAAARSDYARTSVRARIELAESCAAGVAQTAREWVAAACQGKAIAPGSPARAEEVLAGPLATLRYLRLLVHSLRGIERCGVPPLPGRVHVGGDGRLRVPLMPTRLLYDRLLFYPFTVSAWMQDGINRENLREHLAVHYRPAAHRPAKTVVVLGGGNVSAISATDTFSKLFQEGCVVLLKMSPVNADLGPILERALKPLIAAGYLRIIYGGAAEGDAAACHPLADAVHITGSIATHDSLVWGPAGAERDERKRALRPRLDKPVTSELGNVSPWILVPGTYSSRQLVFQAENVAASVTNNASFNCVATKVLLTWKQWPQRARFLDLVDESLQRTPRRVAYYPGAVERFRRFLGPRPSDTATERLPWTLLRDVQPGDSPHFFREESFVCLFVEVALDAPSEEAFFRAAVDFANRQLTGTLCAAVTLPPRFRARAGNERLLQSCLGELRYGTIGVNHWPGVTYALMSPPWGGRPGSTLADPQSGMGWVHNTFLLDGVEKTVLEGPLTVFPKPVWFASHAHPERVAWALFELYRRPSWRRLARCALASLGG